MKNTVLASNKKKKSEEVESKYGVYELKVNLSNLIKIMASFKVELIPEEMAMLLDGKLMVLNRPHKLSRRFAPGNVIVINS